jgi:hypothetical protein
LIRRTPTSAGVNHPVFLQAHADPVRVVRGTSAVAECDAAAAVVARKGNCSDRRESAGSHIPCTTIMDEARLRGMHMRLGTREYRLQRMYVEKSLRGFIEKCRTLFVLFHRSKLFQLRMRLCARRVQRTRANLVGGVSRRVLAWQCGRVAHGTIMAMPRRCRKRSRGGPACVHYLNHYQDMRLPTERLVITSRESTGVARGQPLCFRISLPMVCSRRAGDGRRS